MADGLDASRLKECPAKSAAGELAGGGQLATAHSLTAAGGSSGATKSYTTCCRMQQHQQPSYPCTAAIRGERVKVPADGAAVAAVCGAVAAAADGAVVALCVTQQQAR